MQMNFGASWHSLRELCKDCCSATLTYICQSLLIVQTAVILVVCIKVFQIQVVWKL